MTSSWEDALTRRLRALIRTAPLHRVEASKMRRADEFSDQDLRALALRVLDVVIEKMGLGTGASLEHLREELRPLIRASASDLDDDETANVADAVVLALLNEPARRQAFEEPYLQVASDGTSRRVLQFHLLREREVADGSTVIVATVEGINLYAGMLDYPVEDAQVAEEAVLHAQVQRGRIHDAVQTARRARLRSIEYEQKILSLLETVRRDVAQVDWLGDVLELLDAARGHVGERLTVEREIRRAVEKRLDAVSDDSASQLVALRDTLDECIERHVRLHERLIGANRMYLAEHERQAFRPRAAARLPDLEAEVLRSAALVPTGMLAGLVDALLARLQAPNPPALLRLVTLVDRLLAPRRAEHDDPHDLTDPELEELPGPPRHFEEDDWTAVAILLSEARMPTTLGELASLAQRSGLSDAAIRLLALRVLRAFDPQAETRDGLGVRAAGELLQTDRLFGDELVIERATEETP
jgi:hypothetical protein